MASHSSARAKRLGRPVGGGNQPEEAQRLLLDAAERALATHGYRAATMDVIAREAGYTRTMLYRHFANRGELFEALLQRATRRVVRRVAEQVGSDPAEVIVEAYVMIATQLVGEPPRSSPNRQGPEAWRPF